MQGYIPENHIAHTITRIIDQLDITCLIHSLTLKVHLSIIPSGRTVYRRAHGKGRRPVW